MNTQKEFPFVSIVVCAYNAEHKIGTAIKSLLNQTYPKNKYEIIVVDDCSKDKTIEIISRFPVRLIKHKTNRGIAYARNTGLEHSKGEIYVGFDDDCIADKNWLKELIKIYNIKRDVAGAASLFVEKTNSNFTEKFIQRQGSGSDLFPSFLDKRDIFSRFLHYIKSKTLSIEDLKSKEVLEIGMMSGARASFPRYILKGVGGWDCNLSAGEDTDIIKRIHKKYNHLKFYINPKSKLIHNHGLTFKKYLMRPWRRREYIIMQYKKENKSLPIFPFPILFLFGLIISLLINWKILVLCIILLPQMLYFWFPIKFVKKCEINYLIFTYMFLMEEIVLFSSILIGYLEINFKKQITKPQCQTTKK